MDEGLADPRLAPTSYPFGKTLAENTQPSSTAQEKDSHSSKAPPSRGDEDGTEEKGITPRHSARQRKFGTGRVPDSLRSRIKENLGLAGKTGGKGWESLLLELESESLAASTWKVYSSALKMYENFCAELQPENAWPVTDAVAANFILWGAGEKLLAKSTLEHYLTALRTLGVMQGYPRGNPGWDTAKLLLKGLGNSRVGAPAGRVKTESLTFAVLREIRAGLFRKRGWSSFTKKTVWACCCAGYFGSFRISELLPKRGEIFDKFTDLTWAEVGRLKPDGLVFHVKSPKIYCEGGEWVPVFPFPDKNFCPVRALRKLKQAQKRGGIWDAGLPVFRFESGRALTADVLNTALRTLLKHSKFSNARITSRSLRSGIPSDLESHPGLARDKHVKIWGRWRSTAYKQYMKSGCGPKRWVFKKICKALLTA